MSRYTLGIDTSNYATSLAVFDTAGEVVCAKKRFLPVKEGQLGLRQSDAPQKVIIHGELYIIRQGKTYDLMGRQR